MSASHLNAVNGDLGLHAPQRKQLSVAMEHMRPWVTVEHTQSPPSTIDQLQLAEATTPDIPSATSSSSPSLDPSVYGVPGTLQPVRRPKSNRPENAQKRTDPFQFGTRFLEEGDDIFDHNAWDHVEVDEAYKKFSEEQFEAQRSAPVNDFDKKVFNDHPARFWNKFYSHNTSNFFKDRKWLKQEFPILNEITQPDASPTVLLEVGAGAGNTAFPVLALNKNPGLTIHACDFSKKAIEVIKENGMYKAAEQGEGGTIGTLKASVWDVANPPDPETNLPILPEGLSPSSVDIVVLIFIFSALHPSQWTQALRNIWTVLKPGGIVLFRDYGRGDLAQVRFKKGRYLEENFYVRGDGTRVYFFDEEELRRIWGGNQGGTQGDRNQRECGAQLDGVESQHDGEANAGDINIQTSKLSISPQSPAITDEQSRNPKASEETQTPPKASDEQIPPESNETKTKTQNETPQNHPTKASETSSEEETRPIFEILDFGADRRMLVNRQRRLKMYRCWLQARFQKPYSAIGNF